MGKPSDIPLNVWREAIKCAETALRNLDENYGDVTVEIASIARALMARDDRAATLITTQAEDYEAAAVEATDISEKTALSRMAERLRDLAQAVRGVA